MIALVTGAAGFLGRHIVQHLLTRGDRVRAFCRTAPDEKILSANGSRGNLEIVVGDICSPAAVDSAVRGAERVYHVAGVAGVWGPWKMYHSVNRLGTQHVIDACRRQQVQRLVYTSSPSVAFSETDQCGADESAPYARRWLCHYPHTKALAEQAVLAANDGERLRTCALRPHLIWGPQDRQLLPRVLAQAHSGHLRRVGDGHNLIDIVHVENAAAAHLQAADALTPKSSVCGRAYFISQGQPVNCWQWIDELLSMAGLPPVRRSMSVQAAWRLGATMEAAYRVLRIRTQPPMTRFLASQLGRSHWFDISAARRDFGYEPIISTSQGMSRLAEWLRS